jgi:hypothetical protein
VMGEAVLAGRWRQRQAFQGRGKPRGHGGAAGKK